METKLTSKNLLDELKKPAFKSIFQEFTERSFPRNSLIFTPDHPENLVFIVKKGKVRVYLAFEDKDFSLAILEKGDIYSTHTRAYVSAFEDTQLLTVPTQKFYQLMMSVPVFSETIIKVLGQLLKQSFSIIDNLVFKDVSQRLVEFLLHEAGKHGRQSAEGISVKIDLTMEQLAAIVGSSRQTVSTIINQMLRAGVLAKSDRKEFLIHNPEILKEFPHA